MDGQSGETDLRKVLMYTLHGRLEGSLEVHPSVRTLDHLNLAQRFLRIEPTTWEFEHWTPEQRQVGISKDQVLFLTELSDTLPVTQARVESRQWTREAIHLSVGNCEIKGYMHVPGLLDPVQRLNQSHDLFLAVTAASVVGPDLELATSFLAVNPTHVAAIQTMFPSPESAEVAATEAVRASRE